MSCSLETINEQFRQRNVESFLDTDSRAVIKSQGPGISPATMNVAPRYVQRKKEEK